METGFEGETPDRYKVKVMISPGFADEIVTIFEKQAEDFVRQSSANFMYHIFLPDR